MKATEIAAEVGDGRMHATDVVATCLDRIERFNPVLNAFTAVTAERARARAAALDAAIAAGARPGALAGVPFAVKNLIDVAGLPTLAGSKINRDHPPATADAPLVSRLEAAGAILVGALNMGEYAYDFTGENVHYGPSRNPFDTKRMTGGSSGGSGGAVGGEFGAAGAGIGYQRVNSRPGVVLRLVRIETNLRAPDAGRQLSVRVESGSSRTVGSFGRRSGRVL